MQNEVDRIRYFIIHLILFLSSFLLPMCLFLFLSLFSLFSCFPPCPYSFFLHFVFSFSFKISFSTFLFHSFISCLLLSFSVLTYLFTNSSMYLHIYFHVYLFLLFLFFFPSSSSVLSLSLFLYICSFQSYFLSLKTRGGQTTDREQIQSGPRWCSDIITNRAFIINFYFSKWYRDSIATE
jgi:hypothetical protein